MKKLVLLFAIFFSSLAWAVTPPPVSDGGILPGPKSGILQLNPGKGQSYLSDEFLPKVGSGFVMVLLMVGVIMLIIAGIIYVFSSGESESVGKAKDIILWTLIGLGIAILSLGIVKFVIGIDFSIT